MSKNILISGVGGQGTVLASRLIALVFMEKGEFVRTAETIGMAQRGGCVVSHVRIGSEGDSSIIPLKKADLLISFEPSEAVRCLPRLSENGCCVVSTQTIMPVTASLGGVVYDLDGIIGTLKSSVKNLVLINAAELAEKAGSQKAVNIVLLGAGIGTGFLEITLEEASEALKKMLPEKLHAINLKALQLGFESAKQL